MTDLVNDAPASAYDMGHAQEAEAVATFAVIVDNEPGVLHRVVGPVRRPGVTTSTA